MFYLKRYYPNLQGVFTVLTNFRNALLCKNLNKQTLTLKLNKCQN